jgi:uncharacterized protein
VTRFVGRERELAVLAGLLDEVGAQLGSVYPGRCLLVRGRRRIGKSSLVEELLQRS